MGKKAGRGSKAAGIENALPRNGGSGNAAGKGRGKDGKLTAEGSLKTVFAREDDAVVEQQRHDAANMPVQRTSAGVELEGTIVRVLPYPCPIEVVDTELLDIPIRPKWSNDQDAEEINAHEAGDFEAWLNRMYASHPRARLNFFEHNLEVWRQVWRTIERADIVAMVVDARVPLFHFSTSMFNWMHTELKLDVVVVLNKADLVPPAIIELWYRYFAHARPGIAVVPFVVPKSGSEYVAQPPCVKHLLDALRCCKVQRDGERVPAASFFDRTGEASSEARRSPDEFLTVVFQGDPNMGKSSVMNAVFGRKLVSSSSTPGHTKHFQTHFLSNGVCFCDSPGIVCPKLDMPKALQALFGNVRIAEVREPYHIVRFLAERCHPPLPELLKLAKFRDRDDDPQAAWTPLAICEAFARKGGMFLRGGRPDPYRAANSLLRDALDGRGGLVLCFAPPGAAAAEAIRDAAAAAASADWVDSCQAIGGAEEVDEDRLQEAVDQAVPSSDEDDSDDDSPAPVRKVKNAFAALGDSDEDSSDE